MQLASKPKEGKEQESIQSSTTPETPYGKVTKTQGNSQEVSFLPAGQVSQGCKKQT